MTHSASLCHSCTWRRVITSGTGSQFLLCEASHNDKRFPKYPPQPVGQCIGYENETPYVALEKLGHVLLKGVFSPDDCHQMAAEVERAMKANQDDAVIGSTIRKIVGGRNLLSRWNGWCRITDHPVLRRIFSRVLGVNAGVVRILYFDKPPGKGWSLALHKDRTIAVAEHREPAEPFSKPTTKAGVPHVEASRDVLESMMTIRVHLDAMHERNGPLIVVPGSHRELEANTSKDAHEVTCDAGDVFLMRPLLSHGSKGAAPDTSDHRRVLHLEIAPQQALPSGYRWYQFEPIFPGQDSI